MDDLAFDVRWPNLQAALPARFPKIDAASKPKSLDEFVNMVVAAYPDELDETEAKRQVMQWFAGLNLPEPTPLELRAEPATEVVVDEPEPS